MALLKLKLKEARELSGYGVFVPGVAREVPDAIAINLVRGNSDMWSIEVPESEKNAKTKSFSIDKKFETKKVEEDEKNV